MPSASRSGPPSVSSQQWRGPAVMPPSTRNSPPVMNPPGQSRGRLPFRQYRPASTKISTPEEPIPLAAPVMMAALPDSSPTPTSACVLRERAPAGTEVRTRTGKGRCRPLPRQAGTGWGRYRPALGKYRRFEFQNLRYVRAQEGIPPNLACYPPLTFCIVYPHPDSKHKSA